MSTPKTIRIGVPVVPDVQALVEANPAPIALRDRRGHASQLRLAQQWNRGEALERVRRAQDLSARVRIVRTRIRR